MKSKRSAIKKRPIKFKKPFKHLGFILVCFIILAVSTLAWYRSLVVTPSINLADGLDPEEAAFLQKKISQDKKTTTGVAPAPVVKVTVKDKDTGKEYTGKVILKNIDNPDNTDVTSLATAITQTVVENNTGIKPSPPADPDAPPPLPVGQSCSTVGSGEWAQTGREFLQYCLPGEICTNLKECQICINGKYEPDVFAVCGQGSAVDYITGPDDKTSAPCWHDGVQYANNHSFINKGKCQNGKWVDIPTPPLSDDLEQIEQDFLAEARRKDELHVTPTLAPSIAPTNNSIIKNTNHPDSDYYPTRSACEDGINSNIVECIQLPGGGFGRNPIEVITINSENSQSRDTRCESGEVLETIPPYGTYCVPEIERYEDRDIPITDLLRSNLELENTFMSTDQKEKMVADGCAPGMNGQSLFYGKVGATEKCHIWCDSSNKVRQECLGVPVIDSDSYCKNDNVLVQTSPNNPDYGQEITCNTYLSNSKCVNGTCSSTSGAKCTGDDVIKPTTNDTYLYCDTNTGKYVPYANSKKIYFSPDCPDEYKSKTLEGALLVEELFGDPSLAIHISCDINLENPNNMGWTFTGRPYLNYNLSCNPLIDDYCKYNTTIHELAHVWASLQNDTYNSEYQSFNKYIGCTEDPDNIGNYNFNIDPYRDYGRTNCREAFATTIEAYTSPADACNMKNVSKELYDWVLKSPNSPLYGKEFCLEPEK